MSNNKNLLLLEDFFGQDKLKKSLKTSIQSAKSRNDTLSHILFYGPPGLGKTTLSKIVANEVGGNFKSIIAPVIKKASDIISVLISLEENDILFIDEIHRLPIDIEEILYPAMQDFELNITVGDSEGGNIEIININIPKFTLIGATTQIGKLSDPLFDRFKLKFPLELYSVNELKVIIKNLSEEFNLEIDDISLEIIAKSSRKTPRIAIGILEQLRDYAVVHYNNKITKDMILNVYNEIGIDELGLTVVDLNFLNILYNNFDKKPVGINSIVKIINESKESLESKIEPYLLSLGFIDITSRGRIITDKGIKYLEK